MTNLIIKAFIQVVSVLVLEFANLLLVLRMIIRFELIASLNGSRATDHLIGPLQSEGRQLFASNRR